MINKYHLFCTLFFGSMWMLLLRGFVADEFMPFLHKADSVFVLLTDGIFVVMGLWGLRSRRDWTMLLWFAALVGVDAYLNHQSSFELLNGTREFVGLLFAAPILRRVLKSRFAERFVADADKQLRWFLYIQAVCLVWQLLRYGAGDHGGGSMGNYHSGVVSTLIYILCFYFMVKGWDRARSYKANLLANKQYLLLLIPTFLNETKISFLYLLFFFIFLFEIDRRFILRLIMATPAALLLVGLAGFLYFTIVPNSTEILEDGMIEDYIMGQDLEHLVDVAIAVQESELDTDELFATDLPRFGKLLLVPDALAASGGGLWLGAGVGQFKGGTMTEKSNFARRFDYMLHGSVPFSFFIIIQLGVMGVIWFLADIGSLLATPWHNPLHRNVMWYLWLVTILTLAYNDQFRLSQFCIIFSYIAMIGLQPFARKEGDES